MIRHRIIRGLALTLLTLCVVTWAGSYWRTPAIFLPGKAGDIVKTYSMGNGKAVFSRTAIYLDSPGDFMWDSRIDSSQYYAIARYRFMGFSFQPESGGFSIWHGTIPLWFPTLLSAGILWLVWRKTRPKIRAERAFPIEPTANPGEPAP